MKNVKKIEELSMPWGLYNKTENTWFPPFYETKEEVEKDVENRKKRVTNHFIQSVFRDPDEGAIDRVFEKNFVIKQIEVTKIS